jgi:hypothetical protein
MGKPEFIEIACTILVDGDKAWKIDDGARQVWLPKSQVEMDISGRTPIAVVPLWLAKEKELV